MKAVKSLQTVNALRYAARRLDSFVEIPPRAIEILYDNNIRTVGDADNLRDKELLGLPWFGRVSLVKVRKALDDHRPEAREIPAGQTVPDILDMIAEITKHTRRNDLRAGMVALHRIGELAFRAYTVAVNQQKQAAADREKAA